MDFVTASDADLLRDMAQEADHPDSAFSAWAELFTRHRDYLFYIVRRCYGMHLGGDQGADDLVEETFWKLRQWAHQCDRGNKIEHTFDAASPDAVRRRFRAFLCTIARNAFKDRLRSMKRYPRQLTPIDESIEASTRGHSPEALGELETLLSTLPDDQAQAIRLCMNWYNLEQAAFIFGPGEAEDIARYLGITVAALRKRRQRGVRRLKELAHQQCVDPHVGDRHE